MKSRRAFIDDIFKFCVVGGVTILVPSKAIASYLENFHDIYDDTPPYEIDASEKEMKEKLKKFTMPSVVRDKAMQITPNKKIWMKGEGKNEFLDEKIIKFVDKNNQISLPNQGYTPVKKLFGVKGGHNVYGQWFEVRQRDFRGIIKGFDNNYYSVYHNFKDLFTHQYFCYGLPADNYVVKSCDCCGQTYVYQDFKSDCNSKIVRVYAWYKGCKKCSSGNHDNLSIRAVEPCGTVDGFNIGQDY